MLVPKAKRPVRAPEMAPAMKRGTVSAASMGGWKREFAPPGAAKGRITIGGRGGDVRGVMSESYIPLD